MASTLKAIIRNNSLLVKDRWSWVYWDYQVGLQNELSKSPEQNIDAASNIEFGIVPSGKWWKAGLDYFGTAKNFVFVVWRSDLTNVHFGVRLCSPEAVFGIGRTPRWQVYYSSQGIERDYTANDFQDPYDDVDRFKKTYTFPAEQLAGYIIKADPAWSEDSIVLTVDIDPPSRQD